MERLDAYVECRHSIAKQYQSQLKSLPLTFQAQSSDAYSAFHLFVIQLKLEDIKSTHRDVFDALRSKGIGVNLHYIPVHTQPYYRSMGFSESQFPESENYYSRSISLPMYAGLKQEDFQKTVDCLKKTIR
jgi:dTDP-4-amino-4,6-dideoxygalactose transaminase